MTQSQIMFARNLSFNEGVITQKLAWLGITGSGKTYGAGKMVEGLLDLGVQTVILDPVGVWWSLRLEASGKSPSPYNIPVIGGLKGDIPLEPTAGVLIADLIIDNDLSVVLDVSQLDSSDHYKFALAFATQLLKRRKERPAAMHIVVDEAQEFIPQNSSEKGLEPKVMRAFERLWKLGRNFGIGGSLISQRPQEVNKKVLNMSSTIFAFNMLGTGEREAIRNWIKSNMSGAEDILNTLPSLPVGTCHVFSPQFLEFNAQCKVGAKLTFDGSTTPKFKKSNKPAVVNAPFPIDLQKVQRLMEETKEKVQANDPEFLRNQIASLKAEKARVERELLQAKTLSPAIINPPPQFIEVQVASPELKDSIVLLSELLKNAEETFGKQRTIIGDALHKIQHMRPMDSAELSRLNQQRKLPGQTSFPSRPNKPVDILKIDVQAGNSDDVKLNSGQKRILTVLAQFYPNGRTKSQIAIMAGFAINSGTFGTYLSYLTTSQLIIQFEGVFIITNKGVLQLGDFTPLPTGEGLINYWLTQLKGGERRIFEELVRVFPMPLSKDELANRTGMGAKSGTFGTYLSKLRTLELIAGTKELKSSGVFFE